MSNDPYLLDKNEQRKFQEETKGKGSGVLCPKKNLVIAKKCNVCDQVAVLFNSGNKEDREIAFLKMAKPNFYLSVVTKANPDQPFLLELGKKAGNAILDGVYQKNWVDITHPMAGKGREMMISRSKGSMGFNEYNPSPMLDKADWQIPESVINNLPNLEKDIIEILREGKIPVKKISDLTKDETSTFTFRICPPWDIQSGNRRFMGVVWRHYGGVTQAEVDGTAKIDLSTTGKVEKEVEGGDELAPPWEKETASEPAKVERQKCFGQSAFFDMEDDTCKTCSDFKQCGKAVMKK